MGPAQAGSTSIVEGEKEAWWLDERTKRLIEETMHLNGALTFTVRPGTPLQLTREQVRDRCKFTGFHLFSKLVQVLQYWRNPLFVQETQFIFIPLATLMFQFAESSNS